MISREDEQTRLPFPEGSLDGYLYKAALAYVAAIGLYILLVCKFENSFFSLMCIGAIYTCVNWASSSLVNVAQVAFFDKEKPITVAGRKVLLALTLAILAIPWLFPVYGGVRAIYEIDFSCAEPEHKKPIFPGEKPVFQQKTYRVSLLEYYKNIREMNWLSLSAYKWVYRIRLEHGEELEKGAEEMSKMLFGAQGFSETGGKEVPEEDEPDLVEGAAENLRYQSPENLTPGRLYAISGYNVAIAENDYVIAMFDIAKDFKEKQTARLLFGNGLVNLAERAESSSFSTICIRTDRKLCDGDSIPNMKGKYIGATDLVYGRLHTFREIR